MLPSEEPPDTLEHCCLLLGVRVFITATVKRYRYSTGSYRIGVAIFSLVNVDGAREFLVGPAKRH